VVALLDILGPSINVFALWPYGAFLSYHEDARQIQPIRPFLHGYALRCVHEGVRRCSSKQDYQRDYCVRFHPDDARDSQQAYCRETPHTRVGARKQRGRVSNRSNITACTVYHQDAGTSSKCCLPASGPQVSSTSHHRKAKLDGRGFHVVPMGACTADQSVNPSSLDTGLPERQPFYHVWSSKHAMPV
jgi:hypothetical protein